MIKRTATCTWLITSTFFGIGWNWVQKGERNRLITIFSVVWSIHNKKSQRCFMFPCHRNTNIKASYLLQSWLPEKAFSQAKRVLVFSRYKDGTMEPEVRYGQQCYMWAGFYLLWIIKSIKPALDLHLMSSRCTVCIDSTKNTIVFILLLSLSLSLLLLLLLLFPSSSLLLARGTGGNEVDYGGTDSVGTWDQRNVFCLDIDSVHYSHKFWVAIALYANVLCTTLYWKMIRFNVFLIW